MELYPSIPIACKTSQNEETKQHLIGSRPSLTGPKRSLESRTREGQAADGKFLPVHLRTEQQPVNLFQRAGPTTQCKNRSDMLNLQETKCKRELPHRNKKLPQEQRLSF